MVDLKKFIEMNDISLGEAARMSGYDRTTVSRVASMNYPKWEEKQSEIIEKLKAAGYKEEERAHISVNTDVMIMTRSVSAYKSLADDLSDPDGSLSSSIGMAIGTAERGKTHASKWFARQNDNSVYILFVDGFTQVQVLRDICDAIAHTRPYSFSQCITVLEETCKYQRRLVIIDEADKCPIRHLEMLRGINERCNLPLLLVGEEGLKSKIDQVPRLHSRIRKPVVVFEPINEVDVSAYYTSASGIRIDRPVASLLARRARGGFRTVVNDSLSLARSANASGMTTITESLVQKLD